VSRRDDERVADILDAANEIGAVIELGRNAWDKGRIRRLAAGGFVADVTGRLAPQAPA
jgi:hypothetical protein